MQTRPDAPSVLLVTRIPFWRLGNGERMRLLALVWILGAQTRLSILFLGQFGRAESQVLQALGVRARLILGPGRQDASEERAALEQAFSAEAYDVCVLERSYLHHVRPVIPARCRTVLDTHDLMSQRAATRRALGLDAGDTTLEKELRIFAEYDRVLLIQDEEHALVAPQLGERALLVPHPVGFPKRPVQPDRRRLGFVASRYGANVDGLEWFVERVWPLLDDLDAELHVFGTICDVWSSVQGRRIVCHGFVADLNAVWCSFDVAINPVRWGSGLKIKSIEAMGNGLPLVSTTHASSGLHEVTSIAFARADDEVTFADACRTLVLDTAERERMGSAGHEYAARRFSPRACYEPLMRWVHNR